MTTKRRGRALRDWRAEITMPAQGLISWDLALRIACGVPR